MKVLNFGSMNLDFVYQLEHIVRAGETITSQGLKTYPGGKGLNQSIALGKAGIEVYHAGLIGEDGVSLLGHLKAAGVNTEHVRITTEARTGNAIIQNDRDGENCIILYAGANRCITAGQVDDTLRRFSAGDYLLLQNEINCLDYIVQRAREKGMVLVLNPSPLDQTALALPPEAFSYLLLNEIEAEQILGRNDMDERSMLLALTRRYTRATVVLTLGGKGVLCWKDGSIFCQSAYKTTVVDTTAAGDTFTGYFIAGEMQGLPVEQSLAYAACAAGIAVSRPGAGASIPAKEEVIERMGPEAPPPFSKLA